MNVYDSSRESLQHWRFENAHKPGENDQLHIGLAQHPHQLLLNPRLQSSLEMPGWQKRVRHRKLPGNVQDGRVENVRDNYPNVSLQFFSSDPLKNLPAIASLA